MTDILARKRDGEALRDDEIEFFVRGYTAGTIPDYQAAALLMAIFLRGMEPAEFGKWTHEMLHSGDVLDLSEIPGTKVDKHSTGGVGDKISLILAPLVAEAGVPVPMISGRGLGHTGGTLDKLESIPGFTTQLPVERFRELVATLNCGLIGQTERIAPADRKLYALRDVTSTVPCIPLIASSIMSKKLAEGIDALVLDVKVGSGAFMTNHDDARVLAKTMVEIGQRAGKQVTAMLTDMEQPLGTHIGNTLEVVESLELLQGRGPADSRELTLILGTEMVRLAGDTRPEAEVKASLAALLDNGAAFERFQRIVEAQHGDPSSLDDYKKLPHCDASEEWVAPQTGYVSSFMTANIGRAAMVLGAGRAKKEDTIDPRVGLILHKKRGDAVEAGEPVVQIISDDAVKIAQCRAILDGAIRIGDEPAAVPLVSEVIRG